MKRQNEIWDWHEGKVHFTLPSKRQRETAKRVAAFNLTPGVSEAHPARREQVEEDYCHHSKNSRLILHEARNTLTALFLTLEKLTNPSDPRADLDETIEIVRQLSNRLNGSMEKLGALFPDSNLANLEN
ncbi:MAG: hypothetical protein ACREQW_23485 [Candidatus Binatia bacterium]